MQHFQLGRGGTKIVPGARYYVLAEKARETSRVKLVFVEKPRYCRCKGLATVLNVKTQINAVFTVCTGANVTVEGAVTALPAIDHIPWLLGQERYPFGRLVNAPDYSQESGLLSPSRPPSPYHTRKQPVNTCKDNQQMLKWNEHSGVERGL